MWLSYTTPSMVKFFSSWGFPVYAWYWKTSGRSLQDRSQEPLLAPYKVIRIRNPGNHCLWNPDSWELGSGIQLKESRIPLTIGIRYPQNQLTRNQESSTWNTNPQWVESIILGVVYNLPQIPGNSGWDVNGKPFFDSSHWKIPETNGNSEKVVPFSRLGR